MNKPNTAYFSMEFGLDTNFKTYAGGLGILAGDYIKGAKDYDYPVTGIGILWKQGYTDQRIGADGEPYDSYHNNKYDFLEDTGVKVSVEIRGREVFCKLWKTDKFGNADLYLLDTDLPENEDAWITGQLYGWFGEERIAQEMVLGIGGVRAIRALELPMDIFHFNEGHALFAGLELLREKMEGKAFSFQEALAEVRKEVVFTTHTPIIQGNEVHRMDLLTYMGANLHLSVEEMTYIGGNPFNMTIGALRMAKRSNGVAKLHGETANAMWKGVPRISEIIAITNAIHIPTWVDPEILELAEGAESVGDGAGKLWAAHTKNKQELIKFVQDRNGVKLDEDVLLIGFSRRAAPYKRSNFIFSDLEIIEPLLKGNKLQIVFSGKAHPLDDGGKAIVRSLVDMAEKYPANVVFLENYDMTIGQMLTRGADIWLNNPRRPKEASGTSGMKAAMNGVLNFSILDGWWPEACDHGKNGWQFGDGFESEDEDLLDAHDLEALYQVLTEEVIPAYYEEREKWIYMMAESIRTTRDEFNVKRMLEEYYELLYKYKGSGE
ncbi:MAG: alpha-glucan family phosphorylase [Spirochaetales bacterium]|nr:alpha-glucan family phosphorylase [Spirochaetales bacterium]